VKTYHNTFARVTYMPKRHTEPDPEEIIISLDVVFDCSFSREPAGGYLVTCRELPEVAGYGKTL
jgi:hypothetical protein